MSIFPHPLDQYHVVGPSRSSYSTPHGGIAASSHCTRSGGATTRRPDDQVYNVTVLCQVPVHVWSSSALIEQQWLRSQLRIPHESTVKPTVIQVCRTHHSPRSGPSACELNNMGVRLFLWFNSTSKDLEGLVMVTALLGCKRYKAYMLLCLQLVWHTFGAVPGRWFPCCCERGPYQERTVSCALKEHT